MLAVRDAVVAYRSRQRAALRAVDGVCLTVDRGETVGLVGESGCGKTSLGMAILGAVPLAGGEVRFDGRPTHLADAAERAAFRRRVQLVFQNPNAALHPRLRVGDALREVLRVHRIVPRHEEQARVQALLERVGLAPRHADAFPHAFSGGQRQRIVIARALALGPELLIADEPVSALDVSVQAQILELLRDLRDREGLGCLFIAHDLAVVGALCSRVYVMYSGRVVESGPVHEVFRRPAHPYTRLLLESVPDVVRALNGGRRRAPVAVATAESRHPPGGCPLADRCPFVQDRCRAERPPLAAVADGRASACHFAAQVMETGA